MLKQDLKNYYLVNFDWRETLQDGADLLDHNNLYSSTFLDYANNKPIDRDIYNDVKELTKKAPRLVALYVNLCNVQKKYPYSKLSKEKQQHINDFLGLFAVRESVGCDLLSRKNYLIRFDRILEDIIKSKEPFNNSPMFDMLVSEMRSARSLPEIPQSQARLEVEQEMQNNDRQM